MDRNWLKLARPNDLVKEVQTAGYARFCAYPLERGYAVTLGVALRRIMLASIPGWAIAGYRISEQPRSSLNQVDLDELQLNLKQVVLTTNSTEPMVVRLTASGPSTACDRSATSSE